MTTAVTTATSAKNSIILVRNVPPKLDLGAGRTVLYELLFDEEEESPPLPVTNVFATEAPLYSASERWGASKR